MRPACGHAAVIAVAVLTLLLGGCKTVAESLSAKIGQATGHPAPFPADRSAWTGAPMAAQVAHARSLHVALTVGHAGEFLSWSADGGSGTVRLARAAEIDLKGGTTACRGFVDEITISEQTTRVEDIACWGEGWNYLREPQAIPVLAPAFAEEGRVYTVRRGGTLAVISKLKQADLRKLIILNPGLAEQLPAGTKVLLP